jgi:hypothetical protein
MPSSQELHPVAGARFVCEREADASVYKVSVYAAGGATHRTELRWDAEGHAEVSPPLADPWAQTELIKLARVLKHSQQQRLTRWRGP